jgi:hypothetical protein
MKQRLVLAAVLAVAAIPLPAHAQQWLSDRRLSEGMGVRVGNLELHPGIGGEFGYDSNFFQRAGGIEPVISIYRIRVTPSLTLSTLRGERRGNEPGVAPALTFSAGVHASYNEMWPTDSSNSDAVSAQNRKLGMGATAKVDINPQRPFGADVFADYERVIEPSSDPENDLKDERSFDRDAVRAGVGATWRPGGGVFEWRLGYDVTYNYFEKDLFQVDNNVQHAIVTRGRWRFLPRTALLYDGTYRFIRYTSDGGVVPSDGDVVRARIGLNGLLTNRIALLALVGWTSSFYDVGPSDADTIVLNGEATYFAMAPPTVGAMRIVSTGLSTIGVGFTREIHNSYLSSFYTRNRGYLKASYFLGGLFVAAADLGYSLISFPDGRQYQAFDQHRLDARLFGEYRLSNSVGVNASVLFAQNMSEDPQPQPGAPAAADDLDYTRWQAYIGLRWFM